MTLQHQGNHKKSTYKIFKSFISGGIAGICSKTLVAPIQRIKFLFITSHRNFNYQDYIHDFQYVVRQNGVKNLWRGNVINIARIFPHAAIDFAIFDFLRQKFYHKHDQKQSKTILFFCGATAGATALTLTTPLQFLRLRLAMERDNFSYNNSLEVVKKVYIKQGFLGFYRGYLASIIGIFIYHGSAFFIFTKLKQQIKTYQPNLYTKWYIDFALGGFSAIGQFVAYPFDIVRKRMQAQRLLMEKNQIPREQNYSQLIRSILQKQGFLKGMYKGMTLNIIKAPIGLATVWTIKNKFNRLIDSTYDL